MENTTVKSIYKYLEPARLDVLESGMVAFTPPGRFNDPFEMNPAVELDVTEECLDAEYALFEKDVAPGKPVPPRSLFKAFCAANGGPLSDELQRGISKMCNETYGVLCCTELECDLIMWSHYAQQHEGFVIEFDLTHSFFAQRMHRVVYSPDRPVYTHRDPDPRIFLTKARAWQHEREWRALEHLKKCEPLMGLICGSPRTIYRRAYPKEAVRRIICGCRMAAEDKRRLQLNLSRWGFPECRLQELNLNGRTYEFQTSEIRFGTSSKRFISQM
jgi:hypothetical protein